MDYLVNALTGIQNRFREAGFQFDYDPAAGYLHIINPYGDTYSLKTIYLYRPSSSDVNNYAKPDSLLILSAATAKAARAASPYNHIVVPDGGYRIVIPGLALIRESIADLRETSLTKQSRSVRLRGLTGVIVETLLLGGRKLWSINELSIQSDVSPGLVHRVLSRLEHESLVTISGVGYEKTRMVNNPRALAELWSEEEEAPRTALRGYVYGSSNSMIAQKILACYPDGTIGAVFAANLYEPVLTRVPLPIRVWLPDNFDAKLIRSVDFQETDDGVNVELVSLRKNPWQVHANREPLARVSRWRAWMEVANAKGRVQELADALLAKLEKEWE